MNQNSRWRPVALALTVLGAFSRIVPHPWNFTPVGSASLFSGARLPVWQAYLVPLAILAVTDPILDKGYGVPFLSPLKLFVYASFLISVWLGRRVRTTESVSRIFGACLLNSVQFFLISNFGVWFGSRFYSQTFGGLSMVYVAALPFFAYTLVGDLCFTALFFGLHALLTRTQFATDERVPASA